MENFFIKFVRKRTREYLEDRKKEDKGDLVYLIKVVPSKKI